MAQKTEDAIAKYLAAGIVDLSQPKPPENKPPQHGGTKETVVRSRKTRASRDKTRPHNKPSLIYLASVRRTIEASVYWHEVSGQMIFLKNHIWNYYVAGYNEKPILVMKDLDDREAKFNVVSLKNWGRNEFILEAEFTDLTVPMGDRKTYYLLFKGKKLVRRTELPKIPEKALSIRYSGNGFYQIQEQTVYRGGSDAGGSGPIDTRESWQPSWHPVLSYSGSSWSKSWSSSKQNYIYRDIDKGEKKTTLSVDGQDSANTSASGAARNYVIGLWSLSTTSGSGSITGNHKVYVNKVKFHEYSQANRYSSSSRDFKGVVTGSSSGSISVKGGGTSIFGMSPTNTASIYTFHETNYSYSISNTNSKSTTNNKSFLVFATPKRTTRLPVNRYPANHPVPELAGQPIENDFASYFPTTYMKDGTPRFIRVPGPDFQNPKNYVAAFDVFEDRIYRVTAERLMRPIKEIGIFFTGPSSYTYKPVTKEYQNSQVPSYVLSHKVGSSKKPFKVLVEKYDEGLKFEKGSYVKVFPFTPTEANTKKSPPEKDTLNAYTVGYVAWLFSLYSYCDRPVRYKIKKDPKDKLGTI